MKTELNHKNLEDDRIEELKYKIAEQREKLYDEYYKSIDVEEDKIDEEKVKQIRIQISHLDYKEYKLTHAVTEAEDHECIEWINEGNMFWCDDPYVLAHFGPHTNYFEIVECEEAEYEDFKRSHPELFSENYARDGDDRFDLEIHRLEYMLFRGKYSSEERDNLFLQISIAQYNKYKAYHPVSEEENQKCLEWIYNGNDFDDNPMHIDKDNGDPMNYIDFLQVRDGILRKNRTGELNSELERLPLKISIPEGATYSTYYKIISDINKSLQDLENFKNVEKITPLEEALAIRWILNGRMFIENSLGIAQRDFNDTNFIEGLRFRKKIIDAYRRKLRDWS